MTAKVKSVMSVISEAVETAAGYALVAVGLYAAIFVDMTGGGSLWNNLRHIKSEEAISSPNAIRVIKVPSQVTEEKAHEDRILAVFDTQPASGEVAAVYGAPESIVTRPSAALTDTPAEPSSGKTWKRGLKGDLRSFTVYGKGEQTSSATAARGSATPAAEPTQVKSVSESAAVAASGAATASRPGMSSRLSHGSLSGSETSRNVR